MIISISGKAGSGKDEIGKIIQEFLPEFEIKKWATKVKEIVSLLIGCSMEDLENREFKEKELGEEWWYIKKWYPANPEHKKVFTLIPYIDFDSRIFDGDDSCAWEVIKTTPRLLLQLVGTDCMRNIIHPNTWVVSLLNDYDGDIEIWKDIQGYEGRYQISNFGRVKGLERKIVYGNESKGEYHTKKESILKSTISGKYKMIKLEGNNSVTIHSLVANHFIPKVKNKNYINHIDQNSLNNFYKNLEWCNQSENIISANKNGNGNIGIKQADSKLTEKDVLEIKQYLKTKEYKQIELSKKYNVSPTTITDIKKGRKWKHVGKQVEEIEPILPVKTPNWIITDTRFPNELKAVEDRGGITIRVNRNPEWKWIDKQEWDLHTKGIVPHESETALDDATFDYVIDNNSDIEDLKEKVRKILTEENLYNGA